MKLTVVNDRAGLRIGINENAVVFRPQQIDDLIMKLTFLRTKMRPEPSDKFPANPPRPTLLKSYHVSVDASAREPVLSLRSPVLGWLSFRVPIHCLDEIVARCKETLARIPPATHAIN